MKNFDAITVGTLIKKFRKQAGLTQFELAEQVEIDSKQLGKIERGIHYPSVPTFLKLIKVLDIDVKIFYEEKPINATFEEGYFLQLIKSLSEKERALAIKIIEAIKTTLAR